MKYVSVSEAYTLGDGVDTGAAIVRLTLLTR